MANTTMQLPLGFSEALPDFSITDKWDEKFFNEVIPALTEQGKAERDSGKDWCWVLAGFLTREEAFESLKALGDGWSLPTATDTSIGAMNGIKFQGPCLVDISDGEYDPWKATPHVALRTRGQIAGMFGFNMCHDTTDTKPHLTYFVKKS